MNQSLLKLAVVAGAALATASVQAASTLGETFLLTSSVFYSDDPLTSVATFDTGVAQSGLTPRLDTPNAEISDGRGSYGIYWVDGDSFDLLVRSDPNAGSASDIDFAFIDLNNLVFKEGAVSVDVVGVSFNLAASDLSGYLASFDNPSGATMPGVDVSFQADSTPGQWIVLVQLAGYSAQLVGDQALLRFDVQTAPVPEPGTYGLMALGLAGLAAWSRRRQPARRQG